MSLEEKAWEKFLNENPEFTEGTAHRRYGDYVFDTRYADGVQNGEISYEKALDFVVRDVVREIGLPEPEADYRRAIAEMKKNRIGG